MAVLVAALIPAGTAPAAPRPVRVVLYPIQLKGERAPTQAKLERALRQLSRFMKRVTYGQILVSGQVAPRFEGTTRATAGNIIPQATLDAAMSRAAAAGVRNDGAIPMFVAPSRVDKRSFSNGLISVIQGHGLDRPVATIAHEFGHMLGLDHANAASVCPRPFRPATCATRPRRLDTYGDVFDVMGSGLDRFGAFQLAALGVAPVRDTPPGSARVSVHPLQASHPTLLRLRAAASDWFVESRTSLSWRDSARAVRLPAGVAVSRVAPHYVPGNPSRYPEPLRVPASSPQTVCFAGRDCLKREFFRRGRTLTLPGVFRLRVLGRGSGGSTRVRTTWLDRSPPALSIAGATMVSRFGGGTGLRVRIGARATGAGVASVVVDQGGVVSHVAADQVPGLVAGTHGQGTVRVPLAPGAATATVRLVDAAGHASAPATINLQATPVEAGATIAFAPSLGADETRATQMPAGRAVTVSGVTDPSLSGLVWTLRVIGTTTTLDLPIAADGSFSGSWTPAAPGLYKVIAEVPVQRIPGSIEIRRERFAGWVRG